MPVYRNSGYSLGWIDIRTDTTIKPNYPRTRSIVTQDRLISMFHNNEAHGVKDGDNNFGQHHRRSVEYFK
jgi:hypothetical protein